MPAELNRPIPRRSLLTLLAGVAAVPVLSACSSTSECRREFIDRYRATHGGDAPSEPEIRSACNSSRTRTGSRTGSGYRGSRRGGGSSSGGK